MLSEQCDSKLCSFKDLGCQRRILHQKTEEAFLPEGKLGGRKLAMNHSPHLVTAMVSPGVSDMTFGKQQGRESPSLRVIGPPCQVEDRLL